MRRGLLLAVWTLSCLMIVTGCWDSQYLSTKKMVNGVSLDLAKDNSLMMTIRAIQLKSKGGGQFDVKDQVVQATGQSTYNIGMKIDNMLPGTLEASKTHIVIVGEELAKQGIKAPLEYFYRNPKGYLNSNIIISKGLGSEVLSFPRIDNSPIAFGIMQLVHGAIRTTVTPNQTLYTVWSQLFDPGEDMILPLIKINKNHKELVIDSIALFDGDKFTGQYLSREDSTLLLLLLGKLDKFALVDVPIEGSLVTFQVRKMKRDLQLSVNKATSKIECTIKLNLYGVLISYPTNLGQEVDREQVRLKMNESLNKRAAEIASRLQRSNCDAIGIGRRLRASRYKLWSDIDWGQEYKQVSIKPEIKIHIRNTGIIK